MSKKSIVTLIALGLMAAAVGFMWVTNGDVGSVKTTEEGVTKIFSKVESDAVASIPIALQEGSGVEHESSHVFQSIQALPGVKAATILLDGSAIQVRYASTEIAEESIRQALASAGYASSGGVQQ